MTPPTLDVVPLPAWQLALTLVPPAAALLAALWAGQAPQAASAWRVARGASTLALVAALGALLAVGLAGAGTAWGLRSDLPGALMALLVAFVGCIIVRTSHTGLAGERGERGHVAALMGTLAAVGTVVVANHLALLVLAWLAASLCLQRLLTFFDQRPAARLAAHKKFIVSRVADVCMAGAALLLATSLDSWMIDRLLERAAALPALPVAVQGAMLLVALAALLKCAQLPFHGWLIQVMEAPTPVSALLHAGVVNLGGFVLIRFAPLLAEVPLAQALLVGVGGLSAVLAALVMSTRISIKVSLAWSTCAQMGFMLMQCGLGLPGMALLHLLAHSLYKAHAFLSAGGVVQRTSVSRLLPAAPRPGPAQGAVAGLLSLAATLAAGWWWGVSPQHEPGLWVMAAIVTLAALPLWFGGQGMARGLQVLGAAAVPLAWFGAHAASSAVLSSGALPVEVSPAGPLAWAFVAVLFAGLFALQALLAWAPQGRVALSLYPWFYGGLFLDEHFSRIVLRLWPLPPGPRPIVAPQGVSA